MPINPNLPFPDYHSLPAWGSSSLAAMRKGPPARVIYERDHPSESTDATLLGTLVHCALLTPNLLASEFVQKPDGMSFSTKEGKAWRAERSHISNAQIVPFDAYQTAQNIVEAIHAKRLAGDSIEKASHKEATLLWDCPISREACKGRPDWIAGHWVYDLKVSRHAEGHALGLRAFIDGWMHQLAHYRSGAQALGLDVRGGRLVVVAPKPPHFAYCLEVKTDSLDLLEHENIATLQAMRECRLANEWEGTMETWQKVEPPASANIDILDTMDLSAAPEGEADDDSGSAFL